MPNIDEGSVYSYRGHTVHLVRNSRGKPTDKVYCRRVGSTVGFYLRLPQDATSANCVRTVQRAVDAVLQNSTHDEVLQR